MSVQLKFRRVCETLPLAGYVPSLVQASSEQFSLDDIAGHIGIEDVGAVPFGIVSSQAPQSLDRAFLVLSAQAFCGLGVCDEDRAPLSLEGDLRRGKFRSTDMKIEASNGQTYFCANIAVIRKAVAGLENIAPADVEDTALALQKALVSHALQNNRPVIFVQSLIEDTDKAVLYKADQLLRQRAHAVEDAPVFTLAAE